MYKLYNDDCLSILKTLENKSIDLLVTDPPFGLSTDLPIEKVLLRLEEADRVCKSMMILMDYRNAWQVDSLFHDKKIGELIWEYGWISGGRCKAKNGWFPTHNTILLYGNKEDFKFIEGSIIHRQSGFSSPRQCSYAKKTGHPYEKPVPLLKYLINGALNCKSVLDPFMGSGSTGIASKELNKDFIGIELEKNYYNISKNRMEEN